MIMAAIGRASTKEYKPVFIPHEAHILNLIIAYATKSSRCSCVCWACANTFHLLFRWHRQKEPFEEAHGHNSEVME